MSEIPDVPDDVIERLCEAMHDAYEAAAVVAGWETQERSRKPWSGVPEANKVTMRAAVRLGLVAHLLAHSEDAAAVLGGRVESEPFRLVLNDGFVEDEDRHERVVGPWREVTS